MIKIRIEINNLTRNKLPPQKFFQNITNKLIAIEKLKKLKPKKAKHLKVSLVFISAGASKNLNKSWRKKNTAAGVLAFNFEPEPIRLETETYLGEIFISPEIIKRKAQLALSSFKIELTRYFTHAMLHLLGYNHEGSRLVFRKDEQIMNELENKVLQKTKSD